MDHRLSDLLGEAVASGTITPEQRDRIESLAEDRVRRPRSTSGEVFLWAREVPRGFNAITIAYGVGSLAIMFALGWFLADRWDLLGPGGVLGVSLVYAGIFAVAARIFSRERFPTAHGIAILLIVSTTPLILWAALRTTGVWVRDVGGMCRLQDAPFLECGSHPVVLSAATFVAALAATRWIRFGPLMIPGAAALAVALTQLALEASRGGTTAGLPAWSFVFSASILAALAYEVDRRRGREDYARWLHIAAAVCAASALIGLFDAERANRFLLLPTSFAAMAASLFLRRVVWLVLGLGTLFTYLAWLAGDVFRQKVAFPVILVLIGISVILVTVWIQRTYPRLAARVREANGVTARFPGGAAVLLAPALVAVLVMPSSRLELQWRRSLQRAQWRFDRVLQHRTEARAVRSPRPVQAPVPTPPPVPADTSPPRDSSAGPRDSTVKPPPDSSSFRETTLSK